MNNGGNPDASQTATRKRRGVNLDKNRRLPEREREGEESKPGQNRSSPDQKGVQVRCSSGPLEKRPEGRQDPKGRIRGVDQKIGVRVQRWATALLGLAAVVQGGSGVRGIGPGEPAWISDWGEGSHGSWDTGGTGCSWVLVRQIADVLSAPCMASRQAP